MKKGLTSSDEKMRIVEKIVNQMTDDASLCATDKVKEGRIGCKYRNHFANRQRPAIVELGGEHSAFITILSLRETQGERHA